MRYAISALIAVFCGIGCIVLLPSAVGIGVGAVVAALLYVGLSLALKPERKLGGVVASMLPNGEAAAARVEEARELERQINSTASGIKNPQVKSEIGQLVSDIEALVAYTEKQPSSYRRLSHFLSSYSEQCVSMLRGYQSVEAGATGETRKQAVSDALRGLADLQGVAQGELKRAMGSKVDELSAGSDAIRRLMEMDGYSPDSRDAMAGEGSDTKGKG